MTTRREALKGFALLASTEKIYDGGLAPISLPGVPEREHPILPPGAIRREAFLRKCVACGLCVAACPEKVLKPSGSLASFGRPILNFSLGHCLLDCTRCSQACPTGALRPLKVADRPHVHIGEAMWKKEFCIRVAGNDNCNACERKCPVQAIHIVGGFPVVDGVKCIGCGACEHVCPARPMPAMQVKGFEVQRVVVPMSELDLVSEMKRVLSGGATLAIARDGVIIATENDRGIVPLLRQLDAGLLKRSIVVDKVIGRAAAAICVKGRVKKVYAAVAAQGAVELCAQAGIALVAEKVVPSILNRKQDDSCPMEKAVGDLKDIEKMIDAIRNTVKRMNEK